MPSAPRWRRFHLLSKFIQDITTLTLCLLLSPACQLHLCETNAPSKAPPSMTILIYPLKIVEPLYHKCFLHKVAFHASDTLAPSYNYWDTGLLTEEVVH